MLKVDNINVYYGAIHAIKNVSFQVNEGEIVTLIGANGAGKSTILKTISGLLHTKTGSVSFQDHNLKSAPPHKIVEMGIAHVYERFPRLKERRKQVAGTLSGGEQQMLAMGRALMSRPKLMMLDEPSMGLAPILVDQIFDIVKELNQSGVTILLVEQNAQMALSIANRGYVLETGRIVLSSDADELLHNDAVKKAYLGG